MFFQKNNYWQIWIAVAAVSLAFTIPGFFGNSVQLRAKESYSNPVLKEEKQDIGDPSVIKFKDKYYLYATSEPNLGYRVWQSNDLVEWEGKGLAYDSSLENNIWGMGDFWAPEVIRYRGKFYMAFSTRAPDGHLKVGLAVSEDPLGPFKNLEAPLFDRDASFIDPYIFVADGGEPYLFYVKDCSENLVDGVHTSQIYVQRMEENLRGLKGEPVLVSEPSQTWETGGDYQWNEGPAVIKNKDRYYLTYSANYFGSADYSIGFLKASQPLGPWKKYEGNPILSKNPKKRVYGTGGNNFTLSPDEEELFIVYHSLPDPNSSRVHRVVNIDRLEFQNGVMRVIGPTRSPQPVPSEGEK
ncbi:glycoside hydrolase family 43 protein [Candidatus Bipolaricaulota bacterium]|nr:glycoside hydrolase family 43 protein [Candidatus Bipolaricaulota bacterium]